MAQERAPSSKLITNPVLFKRVAEVFARAVELAPEDQFAFLEKECGSDPGLLRLLQDLLREDRSDTLFNRLPSASAASLPGDHESLSGRMLSHYRILEPIATGGMGIVYRATDTRLQRTVALKFLSPFLVGDTASQERFLREARAVASIDHPNVCPIYEIEETEGLIFIAMACLEGTTLDERMAHGVIPASQAIDIALQTARGLHAAHAKGIVHRDIKPANLIVSKTDTAVSRVRILDFGIAQWAEKSALTQQGLTIGTVSYIAPEQIAGSRVDGRADIWSLGVVLYEMLSGRPLFDGVSAREILAVIAGPRQVDLTPLRKTTRPAILAILEHALEKDPEKRYESARFLIQDLEQLPEAMQGGAVPVRGRARRWQWSLAATLAVLVAISVAWFVKRSRTAVDTEAIKVVPFTFYPGYQEDPAIAPDGNDMAFVGQGKDGTEPLSVYRQPIGTTDPLQLTRAEKGCADRFPVWDPSAKRIAFVRTCRSEPFGHILTVSALGGGETDLGVDKVSASGRLTWSSDGSKLAYTGSMSSGQTAVFEFSLADHAVRQRTFPAAGQSDCCPQYDPSGGRLAFKRNEVEIAVSGRGNEGPRLLPARASWPGLCWTADGVSLIYSWFGKLARVDVASGAITRTPAALGADISDVTIRGKRMALVHWRFEHSMWQLRMPPKERSKSAEPTAPLKTQLITSTMREDTPQFSPSGEWIAFASERSGSNDIWIGRSDGLTLRRLTFLDGQSAGTPRWSPDGKWIAFDLRPPSSKPDIWVVRAEGGSPKRLANNAGGADVPSWSEDGRWIYYHSRSDGQIWKRPWQGGAAVQVTRHGGFEGFESSNGKALYYSKDEENAGLWRLDLETGSEAPVPELAQAGHYRHWALARDGVYFVPANEALREDAAVRLFSFETGKTRAIGVVGKLVTAGPGALAVARDETKLLYVHVDRDIRNIMLVENFE